MVRTRVMGLNCSRRILGEDRRVRLRQTCHSAKLFSVSIASTPRAGASRSSSARRTVYSDFELWACHCGLMPEHESKIAVDDPLVGRSGTG